MVNTANEHNYRDLIHVKLKKATQFSAAGF